MYDESTLLRVIAKLMMQVEEERQRRIELIQAYAKLKPGLVKEPTTEEVERRILELSHESIVWEHPKTKPGFKQFCRRAGAKIFGKFRLS